MIRWLTVFLDLPADDFGPEVGFWSTVTGSALSPPRGDSDEFATLQPPSGAPILKVQRVGDEPARLHLDIHVDDVAAAVEHAVGLGASVVHEDEWTVLSSPAGFVHCLVGHLAGTERPAAHGGVLVDQLAIDVPADQFANEVAYWTAFTGWAAASSPLHPEFTVLDRAPGMPFRLLLHRLGDEDGRPLATAHLDLAAGEDRERLAAAHVAAGARIERETPSWMTLVDPAGLPYCLTARDPATGAI